MLSLNFALTKNDFCNFYLHVMWDAPAKQKKRQWHFLKQIITTILFITVFFITGLFKRSNSFSFIVLVLILLTTILSAIGLRSGIKKEAEKISDHIDNASFFLPTVIIISNGGFHLKDEFTERIFHWPAFTKMEENEGYYFLFYTASEAIILPKRTFRSPQDKEIFEELLAKFLSFEATFKNQIKD